MNVLRTPDERFSAITDFPYPPAYAHITATDGTPLRMHYVDVGSRNGDLILCLHGQPTWSYLYRHMIPLLTTAGFRIVAPDLIGFGRSDKPAQRTDYSYDAHVGWMRSFIEALDLTKITLMCQDWGGLIGLRVATEIPHRFARIVVANTGLPDARGIPDAMTKPMRDLFATIPALPPKEMGARLRANEFGAGFMYWIKYCSEYPDFRISEVVNLSAGGTHTPAEKNAYDAPFPDESFKQGARQFPSLVPIFPDDPAIAANRQAWKVLESFNKPLLTAFSDNDPVTAGGFKRFQESVPGAQGQPHVTIAGAGHFLQEDAPGPLSEAIINFCRANPIGSMH